jgi:ribosomal protein S18 acetylase RimI-like enzyme
MVRESEAPFVFRERLRPTDRDAVRTIVAETEMFDREETDVAVELVDAFLERGTASGYRFLIAERRGKFCGYVCYGPVPGADRRFEVYWIAVAKDGQGSGLGRRLMTETEKRIRRAGGCRVYAETASRRQYLPTRRFYLAVGYRKLGSLPHYYRQGDGKITYMKDLARSLPRQSKGTQR